MPVFLDLFLTFFKIGAVSFGGGYAMIPFFTQESIAHGWLTYEEVINFVAVAESTPGPVAINMATFIGSSVGGFWGSVLATLGVVLPSFILILLIAAVVSGLMKFAGVKAFLGGVRPVVVGLIIGTGITLFLTVITSIKTVGDKFVFDWKAIVVFAVVAITSIVYKKLSKKAISPILLIIISAGLGMLLYGVL